MNQRHPAKAVGVANSRKLSENSLEVNERNTVVIYKFCKHCNKEVVPLVKMFNTLVCPECNIIIYSDKGIDKV